jgi:acyl-CoA thioesterase YciA
MADEQGWIALQVVMMPRDANPMPTVLPGIGSVPLYRTIFGGVILSYIDQAGAIGGRHEVVRAGGPEPILVTVAINRVEFKQPVHVGDVVRFRTSLVKFGRTSLTLRVQVEAERGQELLPVTEAELVYVGVSGIGGDARPVPLFPADPRVT